MAIGLGVAALPALRGQGPGGGTPPPSGPRTIKIGCATLAWNVSPNAPDTFELAMKDISELGYSGFETVNGMLEGLDKDGTMAKLMDKYHIVMKAGYMGTNVTDPSARKDNVANVIRIAKLVKKYGGTYVVIAVNSRRAPGPGRGQGQAAAQPAAGQDPAAAAQGRGRGGGGQGRGPQGPDTFNFMEHKADMVASLNDYGMAVQDVGLGVGLHQHTGTVIETKDEVYGIMESVNTKYMNFAPDVGQLQKGGADAAQVVKDFAKITTHMHLKDYSNGKYMVGYCPLGMGFVDLESILNTLEAAGNNPDVIHELDRGNAPMTARETAAFSKAYLMRLGYKFPMV
jgi:inosose dehydratase